MIRKATIDTIAALSSGRPPAAIAVVRTSGPHVLDVLQRLGGRVPLPRRASLVRLRDPAEGAPLDDALVLHFPGPNTATGEDIVEYQCHGGRAVVERLLGAITAQEGVRLAEPGEFTRRALMNGRLDLTEAEGLADLLEAETESQRKAALLMAEGGLRRQVEDWRSRLVALSARAEAAIDYVDDEDETAADAADLATAAMALRDELGHWLERPRVEAVKEGVRVVLAGPPNVGKSSLLNALLGYERAIVTEIPGTTRDSIEVPVAVEGIAFQLVDTAGLRDSDDVVERAGMDRSRRESARADILVWLGAPQAAPAHPRLVRLHPRCDLPGRDLAPSGTLPVSATAGTNLSALWAALITQARDVLPADGVIALNARQADLIAEARDALDHVQEHDVVLTAESLRHASRAFDRLTGRAGMDDMLDALFGRFCLGK